MTQRYRVLEHDDAALVRFADDEYFGVELYEGYFSLRWTVDLSVAETVSRLLGVLPNMLSADVQLDGAPNPDGGLAAFEDTARNNSVTWLRAELEDVAVVIRPAAAPGRPGDHGELAVVTAIDDPRACTALLIATATPRVEEAHETLARTWAYVRSHVEHGVMAMAKP